MGIREDIAAIDPEAMFADPWGEDWDEAILGTAYSPGRKLLVVYDADKIIDLLVADGMTVEHAEEFFAVNIEGWWGGERTPVFVRRLDDRR